MIKKAKIMTITKKLENKDPIEKPSSNQDCISEYIKSKNKKAKNMYTKHPLPPLLSFVPILFKI